MKLMISFVFLCLTLNGIAIPVPQPALQQTVSAINFSSAGFVAGIQMSGTASWTYGSDQQTGTVLLQANANGQARMELRLDAGTRVETQNPFSDGQRQCTWQGFDGVVHGSASHHCWLDTVWFLPQITMQAGAGASDEVASSTASADGRTVRFHRERRPSNVADDQTTTLLAHLSAIDLDVDAATGLPSSLVFAAHPDNDAGTDLPVEIRYSRYRTTGGVTIPTHIQKLVNNSVVLDLQITDVQVQLAAPATGSPASTIQ